MKWSGDPIMGARERVNFELTVKGSEELSIRTYRLDARMRNILFLIQRGFPTIDGILENSIFPREEVVERLRDLLRGHFLTMQTIEVPPPPPAVPAAPPDSPPTEVPDEPVYFGL
jgi:hypothetical protein